MYSAPAFTAGPIPPGRNEFQLRDSFAVGPGRYKVQWILVDSSGPSCYVEREIQAELRKKDSDLPLRAQPGEVVDSRLRLFRPERAIVGDGPKPRLQSAPSTIISAGPPPDRSYAISVPSFDRVWLMTPSESEGTRAASRREGSARPTAAPRYTWETARG